jgi:hypothetical protein
MNTTFLLLGLAGIFLCIVVTVSVWWFYFREKDNGTEDNEIEDNEIEDNEIEDNEIEDNEIEDNEIEYNEIEYNEIEDYEGGNEDTALIEDTRLELPAVDCVGQWDGPVCPATCDGTVIRDVYRIITPAQNGGIACAFEHLAEQEIICPAVPSECPGPEYNPSTRYPGTSADNYYNYCKHMKTEGMCGRRNVMRNCRDECA